jgi:hypothetical protein
MSAWFLVMHLAARRPTKPVASASSGRTVRARTRIRDRRTAGQGRPATSTNEPGRRDEVAGSARRRTAALTAQLQSWSSGDEDAFLWGRCRACDQGKRVEIPSDESYSAPRSVTLPHREARGPFLRARALSCDQQVRDARAALRSRDLRRALRPGAPQWECRQQHGPRRGRSRLVCAEVEVVPPRPGPALWWPPTSTPASQCPQPRHVPRLEQGPASETAQCRRRRRSGPAGAEVEDNVDRDTPFGSLRRTRLRDWVQRCLTVHRASLEPSAIGRHRPHGRQARAIGGPVSSSTASLCSTWNAQRASTP